MEEAFESLKSQGKNTLDGLVEWMNEANLIDEKITEEKFKKELGNVDATNVDLKSFQTALSNLAKEMKLNVDEMYGQLCSTDSAMKNAFENMKKEGRNSVDHVVKWLQDSKLVDNAKDAEQKARVLFEGAKDKANVELTQFKDAVSKLAEEKKQGAAELAKSLQAQGPKLMGAFTAASSAFKDAMSK